MNPLKFDPLLDPLFFHGVLEPKWSKNKMSYQIISVTSWSSDNFDMIWYKSLMILYRSPLSSLSADKGVNQRVIWFTPFITPKNAIVVLLCRIHYLHNQKRTRADIK